MPPFVAYDESLRFIHKPTLGSKYLIRSSLGSVGKTIEGAARFLSAAKKGSLPEDMPRRVSETHLILSSPWAMSTAKTVSETFEKDSRVSSGMVNSLLHEERKKAGKGSATKGTELIEEKVLDIRLNGYAVAKWQDKTAKDVSDIICHDLRRQRFHGQAAQGSGRRLSEKRGRVPFFAIPEVRRSAGSAS